jgi:hypothetical protein
MDRQEDDIHLRAFAEDGRHRVHAGAIRQAQIHDDHVRPGCLDQRYGFLDGPGLANHVKIRLRVEQADQPITHQGMVVDNEHFHSGSATGTRRVT